MGNPYAFIPFPTGKEHCSLITEFYSEAPWVRVSLHDLSNLASCLPDNPLWIDSGIEGLGELSPTKTIDPTDRRQAWAHEISSLPGHQKIADPAFQRSPDKAVVRQFVVAVLNACVAHKPAMVSVPQLPHVDDGGRNKINRAMAEASAKWHLKHPKVSLVLPVILNHSSHTEKKSARNSHVKLAAECLTTSKARALWIVDASFNDEELSAELRRKRLKSLIAFHEELNKATEHIPCVRIGGPYWAANLVLWSRGIIDYFGTGIGTGYKYYIPGQFIPKPGDPRVALEPLYRRAKVGVKLRDWINKSLESMEPTHPFYKHLVGLKPVAVATSPMARRQTAIVYRSWIDHLAAAPEVGRAMALFQSLSVAFSHGKQLPDLPEDNAARRPESIAEALMLNCW